jgi:hypothetical protein
MYSGLLYEGVADRLEKNSKEKVCGLRLRDTKQNPGFQPGFVGLAWCVAASEAQPEQERDTDDGHGAAGHDIEEGVHDIDRNFGFTVVQCIRHIQLRSISLLKLQDDCQSGKAEQCSCQKEQDLARISQVVENTTAGQECSG